jgi:hypothetical protein
MPEIVHTPEIHLMDLRIIESKPVFHFHWGAIVRMDDTPVGIQGACVFGRKITKSTRGVWSSKAVDKSFSPPFWERTHVGGLSPAWRDHPVYSLTHLSGRMVRRMALMFMLRWGLKRSWLGICVLYGAIFQKRPRTRVSAFSS